MFSTCSSRPHPSRIRSQLLTGCGEKATTQTHFTLGLTTKLPYFKNAAKP